MIDTGLKIAVFIDFDNIEIGVKTTLNLQLDIAAVLEGIKERGEIVTKVAYGDWKRAGEYGRLLSQHAIRMNYHASWRPRVRTSRGKIRLAR